ncbi:MAG TPA: ABC transporter substrate-binding protein, partial [Pseudolysinimonas sp.]|nr:ABC transporter substrate-binding protein [Pseudolysinimonas sp.]
MGGGLALQNIFAGLIFYDADGAPVNDVAESIESDDAQNYTVTIREGLEFTNGEPVTAQSFVSAWDYGAVLSNAQVNSYFFDNIVGFSYDEDSHIEGAGLNVVDDTTFTVELSQPEADWPLRLGYTAFLPLPEVAFEDMEAFGEEPIGNGPYMLDEWVHDERISIVVNPDYDGPRTPQNGGIDLVAYTSLDGAYADLLADNLDVLDAIPPTSLQQYADDLGDRAYNQPAAIFQSFTIPE